MAETVVFHLWLGSLAGYGACESSYHEIQAQAASNGNFGDCVNLRAPASPGNPGQTTGPGLSRLFLRRAKELVILLCGGDKKTQKADIAQAVRMKDEIERRGGDKAV